ncbi:MAG: PAS domain-containing protein [Bacteroidetes bacterium]|nr:PAS domain-containing protein [Bacteroidota bacterium]
MKEAQRIARLGHWEVDFITGKSLWSDETCAIYGLSPEHNIQEADAWLSFVHPDDLEYVTNLINESQKAVADLKLHNRIMLKDGTVKYIYSERKYTFDDNGKCTGLYGITQDITEHKLVEENLRKSEEQFRLISENIADMISVLDLEGKRLYTSSSYKAIVGASQSLIGSDSFMTIHPDDREEIRKVFFDTVKTGMDYRCEYRLLLQDGSIHFIDAHGSVIRNNKGDIIQVVVVFRDITEKKQFEKQLLRVQRMESIGTLAGGIAHDLNNILSPILLSINFLSRKMTDESSLRMLQMIEVSAKRGAELIKQVLSFARGVEGEFTIVQVRHIIDEIGKIITQTFPKTISLRTDIPKYLPTVAADATQIHHVLMILCVNARVAMPNGGMIDIEAETILIDKHYIKTNLEAKIGNYVVITISDKGMGIPPEIMERVFEPFFTTKEFGKGTGLGLSTVATIVKSHNGFINVFSEVSKGTKFKIYLPAHEGIADSIDEKIDLIPQGNGELILIVDDEIDILDITKAILEMSGYSVITATDGTEAITAYSAKQNNISLVITDMMMPTMDGASTIRAIRKMNPKAKFIAVSGLKQSSDIENQDFVKFMHKPYTSEKLLSLVSELLVSA